jgi:hypothetical protein
MRWTSVNIENILMEYPYIPKRIMEINQNIREVIEAKLNADGGIKASIVSDEPRGSGVGNPTYEKTAMFFDHMEDICAELAQFIEYNKMRLRQLQDDKKSIDMALLCLTFDERRIIELRYITYPHPEFKWDKVIRESFYERSQCFELHNRALKKLSQQLNIGLNRTSNVI